MGATSLTCMSSSSNNNNNNNNNNSNTLRNTNNNSKTLNNNEHWFSTSTTIDRIMSLSSPCIYDVEQPPVQNNYGRRTAATAAKMPATAATDIEQPPLQLRMTNSRNCNQGCRTAATAEVGRCCWRKAPVYCRHSCQYH